MEKPLVTAVIANWNGKALLPIILKSLERQTEQRIQTIVVDNGSEDGSVAYLKQHWPKVKLVALPDNKGFAGGMNRGIELADTPYIALLNNDLELDPKWVQCLIQTIKQHPKVGMVGGKLLQYDDRNRFDGTAEVVSWYGTFTPRGHGDIDRGQFDDAGPVFAPNAAAALYRKELFDTVGMFDERFFAYTEDSDLHFRAQLAGFQGFYAPEAKAYHMVSTTGKRNPSHYARYLVNRNRCMLVMKDFPMSKLIRHSPKLTLFSAKIFVGALKDRWLLLLLKAWGAALLRLPLLLPDRWRIQRSRKVSNAYLDQIITSDFPVPSRVLGRKS